MQVSIRIDTEDVRKGLAGIRADMPWVISNTINDLLKNAQQEQWKVMRESFTIRRESFLKNSVRINFAKKNNLEGKISIANLGGKPTSEVWSKFEEGGIKTPRSSKNISVPSIVAWPNKSRVLANKSKPRVLKRKFIINDNGKKYIFARIGRKTQVDSTGKDKNIRLMYTLKSGVRIDDRLSFYKTVIPAIENNYESTINKLLAVSLKSRGFSV